MSDDELKYLKGLANTDLKGAFIKNDKGELGISNNDYSTWVDNDGNKHVTIGANHKPYGNGKVQRGGTYSFVIGKDDEGLKLLPIKANEKNDDYDFDYDNPEALKVIQNIKRRNENNSGYSLTGRQGNIFRIVSSDPSKLFSKWHPVYDKKALGGRTSRLYATGGSMGDIPLGEQPNDYNMINEGGTHEENPMGGVPYGVNQDGSQNMVEEGEVTVGDNVYSDRVELSSDLCQQLGLPQGTTPAQAMQQIEQLYEQGQLQDEEYQEISDIIFQDQENQKQGGEQRCCF